MKRAGVPSFGGPCTISINHGVSVKTGMGCTDITCPSWSRDYSFSWTGRSFAWLSSLYTSRYPFMVGWLGQSLGEDAIDPYYQRPALYLIVRTSPFIKEARTFFNSS